MYCRPSRLWRRCVCSMACITLGQTSPDRPNRPHHRALPPSIAAAHQLSSPAPRIAPDQVRSRDICPRRPRPMARPITAHAATRGPGKAAAGRPRPRRATQKAGPEGQTRGEMTPYTMIKDLQTDDEDEWQSVAYLGRMPYTIGIIL